MKKAVKSREYWRTFMNGYRDPKSRAEEALLFKGLFDPGPSPASGSTGERECGYRKAGGIYATCPTGAAGEANTKPIEHFTLCRPLPITKEDYNLSAVGVRLVDVADACRDCKGPQKSGLVCRTCDGMGIETITHIFDIVGQDNYPNVADFLEEARRMGVSRRLELENKGQYARLSSRSRLFLLHEKAVIENPQVMYRSINLTEAERFARAGCTKDAHQWDTIQGALWSGKEEDYHADGCSALHWHVITGGLPIAETVEDAAALSMAHDQFLEGYRDLENGMLDKGYVRRDLASGRYYGYRKPDGVRLKFSLGVFAVFPLARIEIVDPQGEYSRKVDKASAARVDVGVVEC